MKKSDLIDLLYSFDEEEVFLEIDEYEFDLDVELRDEVFDGFDEVFPSHLVIKPKK